MSSKEARVELLQGTLDLIVLRALSTMGPLHAYALASRLAQVSGRHHVLNLWLEVAVDKKLQGSERHAEREKCTLARR